MLDVRYGYSFLINFMHATERYTDNGVRVDSFLEPPEIRCRFLCTQTNGFCSVYTHM